MRWKGQRSSNNLDDRRSSSGSRSLGIGGGGAMRLLPLVFRYLGFKGGAIVVAGFLAFNYFTGGDLGALLGGSAGTGSNQQTKTVRQTAAEKEQVQFVSVVLADTEDTWKPLFKEMNKTYTEPHLVLFRGAISSACGMGQAAMGPFYCPGDNKVYIDLSFYDDLQNLHNAPGDFAQAYVIAHEIGHHVQTLLGISAKVQKAKRGLSEEKANQLSVKQELQADCFAGIWAYHADKSRNLLESGDIEEGLVAASAIGDDRLQKEARGYVTPESFTHGSSSQRVSWFKQGFKTGKVGSCNTFASKNL